MRLLRWLRLFKKVPQNLDQQASNTRTGTPHIKICSGVQNRMCSDVQNKVGTLHIKMCSDDHTRVGSGDTAYETKGGDTHPCFWFCYGRLHTKFQLTRIFGSIFPVGCSGRVGWGGPSK